MRRKGIMRPRKEVPIYSVWVKESAVVEKILRNDKIYVDASLTGPHTCDIFLGSGPQQKERLAVRILCMESPDEYDLVKGWVSQPEICMLCSILTIKGHEVMLCSDPTGGHKGEDDYDCFSDKLSDKIDANRRPNPFREADFFTTPIKMIRKHHNQDIMKKFDPNSLKDPE